MSDTTPTKSDAAKAAEEARESLGDTLDEIEDRFDIKKRTSEFTEKAKRSYDENPVPWIVGATAALIAVGGLVTWAIFSDD
ncbi:DUF3618 domain-containing protein [Salinibacterium sp. SYSU T00001]|uniref:DUF3618 domain-containing protein n=1 Tax=Homoserinimonas sedimenticola TaxID=2986805 RepID=UPI0022366777|nr:DUF3618 domain-containing protein [Salinibacterium sedimenticola]MCW4385849.1 DUF3618 domain-containing protein [Salinibacterium sedimenticola]